MQTLTKTRLFKSLSLAVCIVLIAATALFTTGCNGNKVTSEPASSQATSSQATVSELGEGKTDFTFKVTDLDGKETEFKIHTDKKTVGEALLELNLIAGDDSEYGLYVKTVNGVTLDYDKDGKYWAFYVNGEYAQKGVDSTDITAGAEYSFKAE